MYVQPNFRRKKDLILAVKEGETVTVFQPGEFAAVMSEPNVSTEVTVEGPHYPDPHSWYARVKVQDGKVVSVR